MSHAPSPWTVTTRPASKRPATIVVDTDKNEVCEVYACPELIAAAPDLLFALRMIEETASGHVPLVNHWVRSVARAAIAKATGETQ